MPRLVAAACLLWAAAGVAQEAEAPAPARLPAAKSAPVEPQAAEQAAALEVAEPAIAQRIEQIHALIAGTLEVSVDPQALFEVDLHDEAAIAVEVVRVRALLAAVAAAEHPPPPPAPPAATSSKPKTKTKLKSKTQAGPPEPAAVPDAGTLRGAIAALDKNLWRARVELDRARLAFYELGPQRRTELLREHAARQEAARPRESERERRVREAEAERQQKLEEARAARTETERVVAEELARLISVEQRAGSVRDDLRAAYDELTARKQSVLVWQRRVREAKAAGKEACDETYDAVRGALRASRDELATTLDNLQSGATSVPTLGEEQLPDLSVQLPSVQQLRTRRAEVAKLLGAVQKAEAKLRADRAAVLLELMTALNVERLSLLSYLSSDKRDAVTGFSLAGWDQASAEVRHLTLILRYQQQVVSDWVASYRTGGPLGLPIWRISAVAVPWLLLIALFSWGKRRTAGLLRLADTRLAAIDRAERRTTPNPLRQSVRFLGKVHVPLEWALFWSLSFWLLPDNAQGVLEVQLLETVITWVIGGALVVNVINAAAGGAGATLFHDDSARGELRLRSLRMVGATVVVFVLILTLSARLVGRGTIYSWVYSTCWFAALPVFLVLVRWWRGEVFERMERMRKKTRLREWVLSNRNGWKSFFAAMIAVVQMFSIGTLKTLRVWLSGFDLARRAHAYLFKRELDRLNDGRSEVHKPLRPQVLQVLHPERALEHWLPSPADEILAGVLERLEEARGGVIAVVGAHGMGKTSLVSELERRYRRAQVLGCTPETSVQLIRSNLRLGHGSDPAQEPMQLVLLDNAHSLVKPVIGGLQAFDELIGFARANCTRCVWLLTLDASIWPFLKRARDARPLFDETHMLLPWHEEQIGALLHDRCRSAGIDPKYDDLLEQLPAGSDELDRIEALQAKQVGYERMLWDHVRGNPALALEAWRHSLEEDLSGKVHVRPLQVPDASGLEQLPDSSLFILRAVLQLAPAGVEDVAQATRLSSEQVINAFRFGQTQGFFVEQDGRVRVCWAWLRAVVRLLERRHLLVTP